MKGEIGMIDLHSHLIWDIDDGSKTREMTINMLKQAYLGGTKKIVLTPHYLPGYYEVPIDEVKERKKEIDILVKEEKLNIEVYFGQEVYFTDKILENLKEGLIGTINDSRYMLIEFNMRDLHIDKVIDVLYELKFYSIVPVIAHPERYHIFIKNPSLINELIKEGFLFQLNIGSLTGDFGSKVRKIAEIFVKNKIYSFIGSDAHRDEKRNPDMSKGIKILKRIDENYFKYINDSSKKLLENEEVNFRGSLIRDKMHIFGIFNKN